MSGELSEAQRLAELDRAAIGRARGRSRRSYNQNWNAKQDLLDAELHLTVHAPPDAAAGTTPPPAPAPPSLRG
ncbi:MAG: hypothetical protein WKG03_10975 [Telluria sp.]